MKVHASVRIAEPRPPPSTWAPRETPIEPVDRFLRSPDRTRAHRSLLDTGAERLAQQRPRTPGPIERASPAPTGMAGRVTPLATTPARNLSCRDATRELEAMRNNGEVAFDTNAQGEVQLRFPMGGVGYTYRDGTGEHPQLRSQWIDPRMAVGVARHNRWAREHGVTEIVHGGWRAGGPHTGGRGFDIHAYRGVEIDPAGGQTRSFDHDVARDWARRPLEGRRRAPSDLELERRTGRQMGYRLEGDLAAGGDRGRRADFFRGAYDNLASEFDDNGLARRSSIGQRSCVLTPDNPIARFARTHRDHFHVDVPQVDPGARRRSTGR